MPPCVRARSLPPRSCSFHDAPLKARKCCLVITKLLYLLGRGEVFTGTEASDLFFATTKLFQSNDVTLRRMVYLMIKELSRRTDEAIIVISCLTKDMNSTTDVYRANAMRVLSRIIDATMLGPIERHLKQAIVDKNGIVASAALVAGTHLERLAPETVKRWVNEVQEAANSNNYMVQYHALGLHYEIKQHDRLSVSKMVHNLTKFGANVRSPHAHCLLIRFACQVLDEEGPEAPGSDQIVDYLETCLRHKKEMVIFEAARGLCGLKHATSANINSALTVLQLFLHSTKPVLRFAAIRTLSKVATQVPASVSNVFLDLEALVGDNNRSVATLAVTTMLRVGSEVSVERLIRQTSTFIFELADEFKIVIVDAIKNMCLKYPRRQRVIMNFLAMNLREEGGYEYKKAIVDTTIELIGAIPEAKESGLYNLCEFIEDCEFVHLACKVLHIVGKEGPTTSQPSKFLRYLYNRVLLDWAAVRASAVSALGKFGIGVPSLRPSVTSLLRRCLRDTEYEVRDRATFYLRLLDAESAVEAAGGPADGAATDAHAAAPTSAVFVKGSEYALNALPVPLSALEREIAAYKANPSGKPLSMAEIQVLGDDLEVERKRAVDEAAKAKQAASGGLGGLDEGANAAGAAGAAYAETLNQIPAFAAMGKLIASSEPVELTEPDTEYVVRCVKHVYAEHLVLQFDVSNTLDDQVLDNVSVKVDVGDAEQYQLESEVPIGRLERDGVTYVGMRRDAAVFESVAVPTILKFIVKDVDPSTGEADEHGYEDEYQLEDLEINVADFMVKWTPPDFDGLWAELAAAEIVDTFVLPFKTITLAVQNVTAFLGLKPINKTEQVAAEKKNHQLTLTGMFMGDKKVAVQAFFVAKDKVIMELTVRSEDEAVSEIVASSV